MPGTPPCHSALIAFSTKARFSRHSLFDFCVGLWLPLSAAGNKFSKSKPLASFRSLVQSLVRLLVDPIPKIKLTYCNDLGHLASRSSSLPSHSLGRINSGSSTGSSISRSAYWSS